MRQRYIADPALNDGATSVADAPLAGLSKYLIEDEQLYLLALDEQWVVASAQAFMQGLYPPYALNNTLGGVLDPLGEVSNGSYVSTLWLFTLLSYEEGRKHHRTNIDERNFLTWN